MISGSLNNIRSNPLPGWGAANNSFPPMDTGALSAGGGMPGNFTQRLEMAAAEKKEGSSTGSDTSVLETPKSAAAGIDKTDKLFEMCRELETFLLKNLISGMRGTVQKSEFLDTGFAGKFYEDMLYDEYSKNMAENAGFGFAEMAYLELSRAKSPVNIKA